MDVSESEDAVPDAGVTAEYTQKPVKAAMEIPELEAA